MALTIKEATALSRLCARLAPSVTNGFIDRLAAELGFRRLDASNKVKKIQMLVSELLADGRSRPTAARAIGALVVEAHHRTVAGSASMSVEDADKIVEDMRALGLPPGELARPQWRSGLKTTDSPPSASTAAPSPPAASRPTPASGPGTVRLPRRHDEALVYIAQLTEDHSRPQHRGRELEKMLADVLSKERLDVQHNIVNPGEQIDLAFVLDGHHYLVECRWHRDPQGLPAVREFSDKVRRKAEGTFGVLVSMSGFADSINATASQGSRLNCVGVTFREILHVLEGRKTFAAVVQAARACASTRTLFYATD